MARRVSKAENALFAVLVLIGLPIYGLSKFFQSAGWVFPTMVVVAIAAFAIWYQYDKKQKRLSYLRDKYRNEVLVQRIFNGNFWEGQSAEQLHDSLGPPVAVDNKLLKTKTKEIWKYRHQGSNRFALRITLENGFVSGWDKKA
jgi:hypothetical protein